jgi:predicted ThiF/HesA family dinucleotide-utilizing enzyme
MNYFSKIIKHGDYYTLRGAKQEVKKHGFYKSTVDLLTNVLELVNTHRGISKARNHLDEANISKNDFNHALRILAQICVNPVTIPKSWKVKFIPSLLWLLGG